MRGNGYVGRKTRDDKMKLVNRGPWAVFLALMLLAPIGVMGQIFQPDGLRIPGQWNAFANTNGMGGNFDLIKSTTGAARWQTTFQFVGATGNQEFKFASGGSGNPWANQWYLGDFGVVNDVTKNTKQSYQWTTNLSVSNTRLAVTTGNYYVVIWRDNGYATTQAVFLELSEAPATFSTISDTETVPDNETYTVMLTVSDALATEEKVYVRYTTNNYTTSSLVAATFDGTSGSAVIPAQSAGSTVKYYAFTTVGTAVETDIPNADLYSMAISSGGEYASVSAVSPPAAIVLTAPAGSASSVGLRPTFTWEADTAATSYQIQVSTVADFASTVINATGIAAQTHTATSNLRMNTAYFWRVRGVNGGGNGAWSEVRSFTTVPATMTMHGNGGSSFGGAIGTGTLSVTHDATHVYFQVNRGTGTWNDFLVLYLDTKTGGIASTSVLTDIADFNRQAISGRVEEPSSDITFPTGFSPDYAVSIGTKRTVPPAYTGFGGVWNLSNGSNMSFVASVGAPSASDAVFSFRVEKALLTFDTDNSFSIAGSYLNGTNGFRSNESYSIGLISTDPGNDDITLRSFHNYPAGSITADVRFFGTAGWRFLANPFPGLTLNDYVGPLWTQGFPGSDAPGLPPASANVRIFDGTAFAPVGSQSDAMPRGTGYLVGVYQADTYGQSGSFPKTVTVTGTPSYESVSAPLNGPEAYALVGNPFPFAIGFNNLTRTGVANIAYVYDYVDVTAIHPDVDPGVGIYRAWNGTVGSLSEGRIASFQSFLVYADGGTPSLLIEASDRTSPTLYYGKEVANHTAELVLKGNGLYSNTWIDISASASAGIDSKDAFKLATFDTHQARLYTVGGGAALDINHLPVPDAVELPLGIESTKPGRMLLERGAWSLPADWAVYVRDTQTGVVRELRDGIALDVEPTVVARKANPINQIERVAAGAPRYTLIIDPTSSTTVPDAGRSTPDAIALHGAYPNPFNPSTLVRFTLDAGRQTRLAVYDVLGREIAVLVDGQMSAGEHRATFDASNLTSGVYIVRLEAGGTSMTRRITLLK